MATAQEYLSRVNAIIAPVIANGHTIPRTMETIAEAKLFLNEVSLIQRQLRAIKTGINTEKKAIRTHYADRLASLGPNPLLGLMAGKKKAAHFSGQRHQQIKHEEAAAVRPYDSIIAAIEQYILVLDQLKLGIQRQVIEQTPKKS